MKPAFGVGGAIIFGGLIGAAVFLGMRRRRSRRFHAPWGMDDLLSKGERKLGQLQREAKRTKGKAKAKLSEDASDLSSRLEDLKKRAVNLRDEAKGLVADKVA